MECEPGKRTGTVSKTIGPERAGVQVLRIPYATVPMIEFMPKPRCSNE